MKNITTILKAGSIAILTFMYCTCSAHTDISDPKNHPDPKDTVISGEKPDKGEKPGAMETFFQQRLAGEKAEYTRNASIKLKDIKDRQKEVWEAWKKANNLWDEEKLPALVKLSDKRKERWNLPVTLEPQAVMNYYWGYKGERPAEGYPLFLYTHGSGNKHGEWETGWKICSAFDDAPSAYFIPQIPNEGNYYRWWQKSKQYAWEKLIRQALISGEINPNRMYVFGISEGGYGSQRLASFYADYWAAAGPMAGGEPLKNAPVENCRNLAFSLRTGALDRGFYRNRLTGYTKDEFDRLEQKNPGSYIHHIELIPGMMHHIDYNPTTPWMKGFVRNPHPKHVTWENFEMDGLYRDGFYNLYVLERSNDNHDSRTCYDLQIKGNELELKVELVDYKCIETDPQWGIQLKFEKHYRKAEKGKLLVYLCPELVDLDKAVTLKVNGKTAFQGKVKAELKHMVNSCAAFYDPERIFPAAIEVDLSKL